jgi:hypothetical protein
MTFVPIKKSRSNLITQTPRKSQILNVENNRLKDQRIFIKHKLLTLPFKDLLKKFMSDENN